MKRLVSTLPLPAPGRRKRVKAGEAELARFVSSWLQAHGIASTLDEAAPGRFSVIARVPGIEGGRSLMLNAHLYTVGVGEMPLALEPVVREGRMYGRGSYDMKSGLAACMLALRDASRSTLRGDVILTAVADEEHTSLGIQSVLRQVRADAAIVTEPTSLHLCVAHKGFTWHEVTTRGRAAHGSRPDLGTDAIVHMGRVLGRLEDLQRELESRPAHPRLGHASVHASLIRGGQELSSYPERCTLHVERPTLPGETLKSIEAEWEALLRPLSHESDFQAEQRVTLVRDAFEVAEDASIVKALREQAEQVLGRAPASMGQSFWMDAAFLAAAGIPTVVFGPHGAGAHAAEEWVDLASAEDCHAVLSATLAAFCA